MSVPVLPRDLADAGVGVARLIRYDPRWPEAFDASAGGFLRSFAGPILSLPFVLVIAAMITGVPTDGHRVDPRLLWAAGLSQLIGTVAYPALVAALVRPLRLGEGYGAFIVVVNWSSLLANIAVTAASALLLLGSFDLFGVVWLVIFGASLFVIWRAARETLSPQISPALMMVVIWVGVVVASDQLSQLLCGVPAPG